MRCVECGKEMEKREGTHRDEESGLKNIVLLNIPVYRCPSCKTTDIEIPRLEELHLLLAFLLVLKPARLSGQEVRYLRKNLGHTEADLASFLGVSRITVHRWETGKTPLRPDHDKHLRRFYLNKKGGEIKRLPDVSRIVSALVDYLPLGSQRKEIRIHPRDWARGAAA